MNMSPEAFREWKDLYQDLKKKTRKNKNWIREWEERPEFWLKNIKRWDKKVRLHEDFEGRLDLLDSVGKRKEGSEAVQGKEERNNYIPYYHRRKFYKRPTDPISLAYHEKCFNRGLRRLRKYNKIPYWLKSKSQQDLKDAGKTFSRKEYLFEKSSPSDVFNHIRRYSRVSLKFQQQGNKSNHHWLKKQQKENTFLRKGIPKNQIGIVHINAGLKNTIISLTDLDKNVKAWVSNGSVGFKRKKRKSPFASYVAGQSIAYKAIDLGFQGIIIHLKGIGRGRHNGCRGLAGTPLKILRIKDQTRLPHNGCRLRKKRRV